jgi:hypothetical protein
MILYMSVGFNYFRKEIQKLNAYFKNVTTVDLGLTDVCWTHICNVRTKTAL